MNRRWWVPWGFLLLPLGLFFTWVILPIIATVTLAFTDWDGVAPGYNWVGMDNFRVLFTTPEFQVSLLNNLKWLIWFVVVNVPIGLGFALLFNREAPYVRVLRTVVYLPIAVSFVAIGYMWSWVLEPSHGALNTLLRSIGADSLARSWLSDPNVVTYALIAAASWQQIPLHMVLFLAGLKLVPKELVEAAAIDGAGYLSRLRHVVVPLIWPATVVAVTLSIVFALRAFDIVYVLTGGGPYYSSSVLGNLMYIEAFHNYRMGYGAAIATVQFAITLVFIGLYLRQVLSQEVHFE